MRSREKVRLCLEEGGAADVLFENFDFTRKLSTWFVEVLDYCHWMLLLPSDASDFGTASAAIGEAPAQSGSGRRQVLFV